MMKNHTKKNKSLLTIDKPVNYNFKRIVQLLINGTEEIPTSRYTNTKTQQECKAKHCAIGNNPDLKTNKQQQQQQKKTNRATDSADSLCNNNSPTVFNI